MYKYLLFFLLVLSAQSIFGQTSKTAYDKILAKRIDSTLSKHPEFKNVIVHKISNGDIWVSGTVKNQSDYTRLEDIFQKIKGLEAVIFGVSIQDSINKKKTKTIATIKNDSL